MRPSGSRLRPFCVRAPRSHPSLEEHWLLGPHKGASRPTPQQRGTAWLRRVALSQGPPWLAPVSLLYDGPRSRNFSMFDPIKGPASPPCPRGGGGLAWPRGWPVQLGPSWLALYPFCVMAPRSHPLVQETLEYWAPIKGPVGPPHPRGDSPSGGGGAPGSPLVPCSCIPSV